MKVKKKHSICIIGGGVTGIATALYLLKKSNRNINVSIIEKENQIGGLLCDHHSNSEWFFHNCQYLSTTQEWVKLLPQNLLFCFPHYYYSYTDLWNQTSVLNGFAFPVFDNQLKSLKINGNNSYESLHERLAAYPDEIALGLHEWVAHLGLDSRKLHHSSAVPLQIARVYPQKYMHDVAVYKEKNLVANELYGVPRSLRNDSFPLASLPICGYNRFFERIESDILNLGGVFFKGAQVIPNKCIDDWKMPTDLSMQNIDHLIWTASPTALIRKCENEKLNSLYMSMQNIVFQCSANISYKPFYIQVYSKSSFITRIFYYDKKITVECTANSRPSSTKDECQLILNRFFKDIQIESSGIAYNEKRYSIISCEDFRLLNSVTNKYNSDEQGIVMCSPWVEFGRDAKIDYLLKLIDKRNI